jgi:hypothetical protein
LTKKVATLASEVGIKTVEKWPKIGHLKFVDRERKAKVSLREGVDREAKSLCHPRSKGIWDVHRKKGEMTRVSGQTTRIPVSS